jgi:hypothetical protein
MSELVDVRADAIAPGECICLGGADILITAVECSGGTVDLHTCYGPALRFVRGDVVSLVVPASSWSAA